MNEEIKTPKGATQGDAALINSFLEGNRAAFDQIVLRYKDKMYNLCYCFLDDHEEANDAAQEIFIKICRSLKQFKFKSSFSTWLYRIAVNTCRNRLKSADYRHRRKRVSIDNPGVSLDSPGSMEIRDRSPSPSIELEKRERSMLIRRAIKSLPPEQKTVVTLRDIEGLSYDEIAKITGLHLGTVKSKIARARLDLKDKLKGVI